MSYYFVHLSKTKYLYRFPFELFDFEIGLDLAFVNLSRVIGSLGLQIVAK